MELTTDAAPTPRRIRVDGSEPTPLNRISRASLVELRRNRQRTDLVFEALLGAAACLSLVAVVHRVGSADAVSTDAPPPAVFVHTEVVSTD